jgi:hypothetical protein
VGGMAGLIEGQNRAVLLFAIIPFQKKNCNTSVFAIGFSFFFDAFISLVLFIIAYPL